MAPDLMQSVIDQLKHDISTAARDGRALRIRGGGTKDFYGGELRGDVLDVSRFSGVVDYEPSELVITARAGTPLGELTATLASRGQMLPFEPPHFGATATLGGCIAAGLSGPRRAYAGAVRDLVLGVRLLDGQARDLHFGGQVMKNVAGYDVSRLIAGSMGTLGIVLEVSLKVLPLPAHEATVQRECAPGEALALMNAWAGQPLPISATAYCDGLMRVRLSGAPSAVNAAVRTLGGAVVDPAEAQAYWLGIREQADAFFSGDGPLWRLSLKSTTPPLNLPGRQLIEWGGALRWVRSTADANTLREAARFGGGHATLFRGGDKSAGVFQPLPQALLSLHRRLKKTFDPAGILNPGRLYPDF